LASTLTLSGVDPAYGAVRALEGISIAVPAGETGALLGTNGNGKSTLMKSIMRIVRPSPGRITAEIAGERQDAVGPGTEELVDRAIALVPEGWRLSPKLRVEETLRLGAFRPLAREAMRRNLEFCYETFPRLRERRQQLAGSMSGGEQQMLALGRALMTA